MHIFCTIVSHDQNDYAQNTIGGDGTPTDSIRGASGVLELKFSGVFFFAHFESTSDSCSLVRFSRKSRSRRKQQQQQSRAPRVTVVVLLILFFFYQSRFHNIITIFLSRTVTILLMLRVYGFCSRSAYIIGN